MEQEIKNQKPKKVRKGRKSAKMEPSEAPDEIKNQSIHHDQSPHQSHQSHASCGWSSEVIQPALKTMSFRKKRGTRMKELIKGKPKKDHFWDKYKDYFGGDINKSGDSEDEEDYQASSSGRDQFDSDFDLTDSYVGKRGRKKGTKIKKRKPRVPKNEQEIPEGQPKPKRKCGRKKKVLIEEASVQKPEILLKEQKLQKNEQIQEIKEQKIVNLEQARQECQNKQIMVREDNPEVMVVEREIEKQEVGQVQDQKLKQGQELDKEVNGEIGLQQ